MGYGSAVSNNVLEMIRNDWVFKTFVSANFWSMKNLVNVSDFIIFFFSNSHGRGGLLLYIVFTLNKNDDFGFS